MTHQYRLDFRRLWLCLLCYRCRFSLTNKLAWFAFSTQDLLFFSRFLFHNKVNSISAESLIEASFPKTVHFPSFQHFSFLLIAVVLCISVNLFSLSLLQLFLFPLDSANISSLFLFSPSLFHIWASWAWISLQTCWLFPVLVTFVSLYLTTLLSVFDCYGSSALPVFLTIYRLFLLLVIERSGLLWPTV